MQIDERSLPEIAELLNRNAKLADIKLTDNRMSCTEFEHVGLDLMKVLSRNNTVTVSLPRARQRVCGVNLYCGSFVLVRAISLVRTFRS